MLAGQSATSTPKLVLYLLLNSAADSTVAKPEGEDAGVTDDIRFTTLRISS